MGLFGNSAADESKREADQARADEAARQDRITQGTNKINDTFNGQFNDNYYNGLQQGYEDYANPQLSDQMATAQKALTFSLDRSGMLDSSTRAQQEADLQKTFDTASRGIGDQALSYANEAKSSVESARQNLVSSLDATGNADAAATSAVNQATALSVPPAYSALGDIFGTVTSGLASSAQAAKNEAMYGPLARALNPPSAVTAASGSAVKNYN